MPHAEPTTIQSFLSSLSDSLGAFFERWTRLDLLLPTSLLELEHCLAAILRSFHDQLVSIILAFWIYSTSLITNTTKQYCDNFEGAYHKQNRDVTLTFLGGNSYKFRIPWMGHRRTGPGRRRASGKRGRSQGLGRYPVLQALGFVSKYSPAAATARGLATVSACSFLAARQQLAPLGLDSGQRSLLDSTDDLGKLCLGHLDEWLDRPDSTVSPWGDGFNLSGRNLVITLDGGRARLRISKKGRRQKNGHHGFEAVWVEPRLFALYVTNDKGEQDKGFGRIVDGCMGDADQTIALLRRYLNALDVKRAARVVIVADGARWMWSRASEVLLGLGVEEDKITEVLDFYHASQHIYEAAQAQQNWSSGWRTSWSKNQREALRQGRVQDVIDACDKLFREERREEMEGLANYLQNNKSRCGYDKCRENKLPCGSGVIESTVRQVLCMRIKGCGKFWKRAQCEQMVRLRSWQVSGRLEALINWALTRRAAWWDGSIKTLNHKHKVAA